MNKILCTFAGLSISALLCAQAEQEVQKHNMKVGEAVTITLDSNRSTGYSWHIKNDDSDEISKVGSNKMSIIKYQSNYIAFANTLERGTRLVGAPGREEWTFIASRPGDAKVTIEYVRPWQPAEVAKSEVLEFHVEQ